MHVTMLQKHGRSELMRAIHPVMGLVTGASGINREAVTKRSLGIRYRALVLVGRRMPRGTSAGVRMYGWQSDARSHGRVGKIFDN